MGVLSAIYSGQQGLLRAYESNTLRAGRINQVNHSVEAQESLASDLVGSSIDTTAAKANMRVISVSTELMTELIRSMGR